MALVNFVRSPPRPTTWSSQRGAELLNEVSWISFQGLWWYFGTGAKYFPTQMSMKWPRTRTRGSGKQECMQADGGDLEHRNSHENENSRMAQARPKTKTVEKM
jgi:hypothetical protein